MIVREGPGTWPRNADWDEYLIEVRHISAAPIQLTGITLFDSMDQPNTASASRSALVDASRKNARRYRDSGFKFAAGRGSNFPVSVEAGQSQALDIFFPLAPTPRRIEIQ